MTGNEAKAAANMTQRSLGCIMTVYLTLDVS
jgi:hypothetical protein